MFFIGGELTKVGVWNLLIMGSLKNILLTVILLLLGVAQLHAADLSDGVSSDRVLNLFKTIEGPKDESIGIEITYAYAMVNSGSASWDFLGGAMYGLAYKFKQPISKVNSLETYLKFSANYIDARSKNAAFVALDMSRSDAPGDNGFGKGLLFAAGFNSVESGLHFGYGVQMSYTFSLENSTRAGLVLNIIVLDPFASINYGAKILL